MAGEGTKRIIDLTEAAETQNGDYIAIDSTGRGTRKLPAGFMATAEDLSEEQTARETADATLDGKITAEAQARANAIEAEQTAREEADADIKSDLNDIDGFIGIERIAQNAINGFDSANTTWTNNNNSPFVYRNVTFDFSGLKINRIKLYVDTAGTLSMGVIKKDDVVDPVDRSKAIVKATFTTSTTGLQELTTETPFTVGEDEFLFVCLPSDTLHWRYGPNGTDKYFYYVVNDRMVWNGTNQSLGIDVHVEGKRTPSNIRELISSIYNGKSLSILGDSISTFSGYIPEGNATYYPAGTVTAVTDTWWKKLIDALGLELDTNNSWSGSRVTTTAGETSAGCMTRCQNLGTNPDVIIVWMGINDFNNEVALGAYDGTTAVPTATTTFREAYGIMLNKILTKYQTSEVWVCTLPQCERNAESGFPEINGNGVALVEFNKAILELATAFGVKVLDHNKSGLTYQNMPTFNPDNLHPNKYGHSLIANNDIRQMDNTVKTRYSIS